MTGSPGVSAGGAEDKGARGIGLEKPIREGESEFGEECVANDDHHAGGDNGLSCSTADRLRATVLDVEDTRLGGIEDNFRNCKSFRGMRKLSGVVGHGVLWVDWEKRNWVEGVRQGWDVLHVKPL